MRKFVLGFCAVAISWFAGDASAAFVAFNSPSPQATGNSSFTGTISYEFTVEDPQGIVVTSLGTYDSGQDGIANASGILVQMWDTTSMTVVPGLSASITTPNSSVAAGSAFRFLDTFSPVTLAAGTYRVAASGFGSGDTHGNTNNGSPSPTFDNGGGLISTPTPNSFYAHSAGVYPTITDSPGINQYLGPTFTFTAVPVAAGPPIPEPTSLALCGLGALVLRRKASRRRCV